jgi:Tfp pilus assembly protein PilF
LAVLRALDLIVRREARILFVLCAIALVSFLATRAFAAHNRRVAAGDAARWHAIGVARLGAGQAAGAVQAFRTAARIDREDREHRLALADALRRSGENAEALDVLSRLRETYPEDVEVNATLARLEAARGNEEGAVRYYQAAILGLWQPANLPSRRELRIELIEFLLARGASDRAQAEALKLSGEIPDTAAAHVTSGRLLLRAGSAARAETQFVAALRLDPRSQDAIEGAGEAAFDAGDYERARELLARAPGRREPDGMLALATLVLASDPLLPHLTARDRDRRLAAAVDALAARAAGCPAAPAPKQELTELQASLADRRRTSADSLGADLLRLARLARDVAAACGPEQPIDRAILLIARRHGLEPQ